MNEFELIQGTTKILKCTIYDADAKTLLDMSTATNIQFGAKRYGESGAANILKTLNEGVTVNGLGLLEIILAPNDTIDLLGKFQYEIRITDVNMNVFVPISGLFTIKPKSI